MFHGKPLKEMSQSLESILCTTQEMENALHNITAHLESVEKHINQQQQHRATNRFAASRVLLFIQEALANVPIPLLTDFLGQRKQELTDDQFKLEIVVICTVLDPCRLDDLAATMSADMMTIAGLLARTDTLDRKLLETLAQAIQTWLDATVHVDGSAGRLAAIICESTPSATWLDELTQLRLNQPDVSPTIYAKAEDMLSGLALFQRTHQDSILWMIRECEISDLVTVLSQEPEEVADHFLNHVAQRVGAMMRDDIEYIDIANLEESGKARRALARVVRALMRNGKIQFSISQDELQDDIIEDQLLTEPNE